MLRGPVSSQDRKDLTWLLRDASIATMRVHPGSAAAGATIGKLNLRRDHGLTVLAVRRGEQIISEPGADTGLEPGDLLVLMAKPELLASGRPLFGTS
jgi:CPA2 family monovalent cation:H+ antiporter-2